jgi:hypothetical protein
VGYWNTFRCLQVLSSVSWTPHDDPQTGHGNLDPPWEIYEDIDPLFLVVEPYLPNNPRFLRAEKSPEKFL